MNSRDANKVLGLVLALPILICVQGPVILYRGVWQAIVPVMAVTTLLSYMLSELGLMANIGGWLLIFICIQYMSFTAVFAMELVRRRCQD